MSGLGENRESEYINRFTDTFIDKQLYESGLARRVSAGELVIGQEYYARFADTGPDIESIEYVEYKVVVREIITEDGNKMVVYTFVFHDGNQTVKIDDTGFMNGRAETSEGILTKEGYFVGDEQWDSLLQISETRQLEAV